MNWGLPEQINELERLLTSGLIGMYRSFEVTEIFGFRCDGPPTNFLSLFVAEPAEPVLRAEPSTPFLNAKPLVLKGAGWKFGVSRSIIAPQVLIDTLRKYNETGEWKLSNYPLKVGRLTPVPPQFVPSDSYKPSPWNSVLKNNFWEGSHVLELFDMVKEDVRFLLEKPKLLTNLAALISPYVPIGIDGLSDRLGNILIQLPVTVTVMNMCRSDDGDYLFQPVWHPNVTPKQLRVSCEIYEDSTVEGFASQSVGGEVAKFPLHSQHGGPRYIAWDDTNQVIVGASAGTAFITSIGMNMHLGFGATREFVAPASSGQLMSHQVVLKSDGRQHVIGQTSSDPREPWKSQRVFRESLRTLQGRKEFLQYGGGSGYGREKALEDIRWLLDRHGKNGAWIWDPYLDASDILNTLFFCPHAGADLRALTAGKVPPESPGIETSKSVTSAPVGPEHPLGSDGGASAATALPTPSTEATLSPSEVQNPSWKTIQATILESSKGNGEGLKLEFRIRGGGAGWSFHDRFLIFPGETGSALAWSLGASVNSLGQRHHILQKVSDGELIRQAFLDLWDALDGPNYIVWKTA